MTAVNLKRVRSGRLTAEKFASLQRNESQMLGLFDGLQLVRRHLRLIGAITAICTSLAAVVVYNLPRIFVANSTIVLERKERRPFESDLQLKSQDRDRSAAETEMDIITSRLVMDRVVDALNLVKNPTFNKYLRNAETAATSQTDKTAVDEGVQRNEAISTLISQVSVSRSGESLAISLKVSNGDPKLAAKLADSIADAYVNVSMQFKLQYASKMLQFLRERGDQPLLTTLRNEEVKLLQGRAELAVKFGNSHPQIQAFDAQIDGARKMMSDEIERIAQELGNEAERPSARVISRAEIPTEPSFPPSGLIVSGAFVGSGLLSIILALIIEGMGTAIRSGDRTMQMLQLPNLAYVPLVPRSKRRPRLDPVHEILTRPQSGFAEAMRSLYLACRVPNSDRPYQVIMLTSCLPGAGKTAMSIGLAATAAADGRKTALVDLDLHNCRVLKELKLESAGYSVEEFLTGERGLSDVVQHIPDLPGLSIIGSGQRPFGPSGLLNSSRLRDLVKELRTEHEFVVIDTPPVLSVDDANWLAPLLDGAILAIAWGRTKESELWEAASSLRLNLAPLLGTVINQVDPRTQSRFGLGGALKYRNQSQDYIGG